MPDGELRRPPQLWEQKLARTTSVLGMGVGGDATAVVDATPTPGSDEGTEPAPTTPAPEDFIAPSTPTLSGTVQGIRVSWDGNNANGDPYPAGAYVEVHISTTGATFTPDATTLAGRLLGSAGFFTIGALTAGTTYYVRLVGVDEAGNTTDPSTAASSQTGLTTSSDYGTATIGSGAVSFDARAIGGITTTVGTTAPSSPVTGDIWLDSTGGAITHKRWSGSAWVTQAFDSESISAGAITATQIAAGAITAGAIAAGAITTAKLDAGAITADKIAAATITGDKIAANTIDASKISAAFITATDVGSGGSTTIDGGRITTGTVAAARIDVDNLTVKKLTSGSFSERRVQIGAVGETDAVSFKGASTSNGWYIAHNSGNSNLSLTSDYGTVRFEVYEGFYVNGATELFGALASPSTSIPNVRINTSTGEIRHTTHANSAQRFKHEVIPLDDSAFGGNISPDVLGNPDQQAVDPFDVLAITPIQYRRNEAPDVVVTGFLAEDVEQKFPTAATYDDDGVLETVDERAVVAALLAVVKQQQQQITDLTARIEALEA
jgi:hypothetical protein